MKFLPSRPKFTSLFRAGFSILALASYSASFLCQQNAVAQEMSPAGLAAVVPVSVVLQPHCAERFLDGTVVKDWGVAAPDPYTPPASLPKASACAPKIWSQFKEAHLQCSNIQVMASNGLQVPLSGCYGAGGPCYDSRDDCMTSFFFRDFRNTLGSYGNVVNSPGTAIWGYFPAAVYNLVDQRDPVCMDSDCTFNLFRSGRLYFDEKCEPVEATKDQTACGAGELEYNLSPVSLIWEKGTDVDAEVNLARFKILADNQDRWVLWKGSSKAPLVVYDPDHNGVISSGIQLFGNWALGGRRTISAGAPVRLNEVVPSSPWSNGFEALKAMDSNGDKKISNEELTPLALWFDKNRDAISQPGEVVRMSDAGVIEIFFEGYMSEGAQNALKLKKGYSREVAGKRSPLTGESIDWYTDSSIEPSTLIQKLISQGSKTPAGANATFVEPDASVLPLRSTGKSREILGLDIDPSKNVGGLWFWQIMDGRNDDVIEKHGAFTIADANDGRIRGRSWGFKYLREPLGLASQVLQSALIEGTKKRAGTISVEFGIVRDRTSDFSVRSNATLSPDGMALEGVSVASFDLGGKRTKATYRWIARRYSPTDSRSAFATAAAVQAGEIQY